jgi:hypothetical protein
MLLAPDALASLELDKIAPVPDATRRRGVKYVRAFRAWAYEGISTAPRLSLICGLSASTIRHARQEDGWRAFLAKRHEHESAARYGIAAGNVSPILPANGHLIAANEGRERGETCSMLQSEIAIIRQQMRDERDKGSKRYSCLLASLTDARKELDCLLGIGAISRAKEAGAMQAARLQANAADAITKGLRGNGPRNGTPHAHTNLASLNGRAMNADAVLITDGDAITPDTITSLSPPPDAACEPG